MKFIKLIRNRLAIGMSCMATHILLAQSSQFGRAVICAGAATLDNGSIVSIGQPFAGTLIAAGGGVTLRVGIIPTMTPASVAVMPPNSPSLSTDIWQQARGFAFHFPTQPGHNYVVEASTNLSSWWPIWTNLGDGNTVNFADSNAVFYPQRFYRVVAQ
jgi:hypothetical protein